MAAFRVDADALRKQLREDRALRSSVTSLRSSAGSSAVKEYARPASRAHLESFDDLMKTAAQRCPPRPSTAPDPTLPRSLALWPAHLVCYFVCRVSGRRETLTGLGAASGSLAGERASVAAGTENSAPQIAPATPQQLQHWKEQAVKRERARAARKAAAHVIQASFRRWRARRADPCARRAPAQPPARPAAHVAPVAMEPPSQRAPALAAVYPADATRASSESPPAPAPARAASLDDEPSPPAAAPRSPPSAARQRSPPVPVPAAVAFSPPVGGRAAAGPPPHALDEEPVRGASPPGAAAGAPERVRAGLAALSSPQRAALRAALRGQRVRRRMRGNAVQGIVTKLRESVRLHAELLREAAEGAEEDKSAADRALEAQMLRQLEGTRGSPSPPLPPVLTGHVSSLLPY